MQGEILDYLVHGAPESAGHSSRYSRQSAHRHRRRTREDRVGLVNPACPEPRWYEDRTALRFIALRFAPLLGALNLAWEVAQLPLYTLWQDATPAFKAYAVVHCTLGDVLIGTSALALALLVTRARGPQAWRWGVVAALVVAIGVGYTIFSEWLNTVVRDGWAYAASMPTVRIGALEIGIAPLAQWLVVPPLALVLARGRRRS